MAQRITAPTSAPALVVAAVVHAELMTLQPFTYGSGLVARAVDRLVLAGRGIDPDNWSVPEAGSAYPRADDPCPHIAGVRHGQPEAVAAWVRFYCAAVAAGTEGLAALVQ